MIEPPDKTWHIEALLQDRRILTEKIVQFLLSLESDGFSGETISRVLGPIFGLYVRDHMYETPNSASRGMRDDILNSLPHGMRPELIDEFARSLGYVSKKDQEG